MIRINKTAICPDALSVGGTAACETLCADYDRVQQEGTLGNWRPEFDNKIYAHSTVKDTLRVDQHEKCAYCEGKFEAFHFGDVEHFRPKAGFHEGSHGTRQRPGYYWLAYDWDNLLLSCEQCNRRYKKNYFPLVDPSTRVTSHRDRDSVTEELPLLVCPTVEDPEEHIGFTEELAFGKTDKGRETIRRCGLDREALTELRREHFQKIKHDRLLALIDLGSVPSTLLNDIFPGVSLLELVEAQQEATAALQVAASSESQFAGMIRSAFPELPQ